MKKRKGIITMLLVMITACFVAIGITPKMQAKAATVVTAEDLKTLNSDGDNRITLKELQTAVEGYIEVVPSIFRGYLDVLNEEGKLKGQYFNIITYLLLDREYVGNVLICPTKIFEKPDWKRITDTKSFVFSLESNGR